MDWSTGWNPNANDWSLGFQDQLAPQELGAIGVEPLYPTSVRQNARESFPGQFGPGGFGAASTPVPGTYKGSGGYFYALRADGSIQIAPGSPRGVGVVVAPGSKDYDNIFADLAANKWTPASADPMETFDPFAPSEPKEKVPWWKAVGQAFKDVKVEDVVRAIPPRTASQLPQMAPPVAEQQRQAAAAALASRRMAVTLGLSALGLATIGVGVWLATRSRT
jgi:hypothetical protein